MCFLDGSFKIMTRMRFFPEIHELSLLLQNNFFKRYVVFPSVITSRVKQNIVRYYKNAIRFTDEG